MTERSNQAIAVSGCILHQSLMATGCEAAPAAIAPVVHWALENEIGIVPWTCPETMFAGLPRATRGIERYRSDGFADAVQPLAQDFASYLRRQAAGGVNILALVGVSFSPACSASRQAYHANERGLFIAALAEALGEDCPPVIDIDRAKSDTIRDRLNALIEPRLV